MTSLAWQQTQSRLGQFLALTKPRVVSLIVFCAVIGMFLAVPFGALDARFAWLALAATVGIALVAGAAAAINCLVEQKVLVGDHGRLVVTDALVVAGLDQAANGSRHLGTPRARLGVLSSKPVDLVITGHVD